MSPIASPHHNSGEGRARWQPPKREPSSKTIIKQIAARQKAAKAKESKDK